MISPMAHLSLHLHHFKKKKKKKNVLTCKKYEEFYSMLCYLYTNTIYHVMLISL